MNRNLAMVSGPVAAIAASTAGVGSVAIRAAKEVVSRPGTVPFVQTITPGEEAAEPTAAAEPAASASAEPAASSISGEAAPQTDGAANSGVKEYNADGQETAEGQDRSEPLNGATTAAIVGGIVVVLAVAGAATYFAYLKPKRAKQAQAAAAAAAAAKPRGE